VADIVSAPGSYYTNLVPEADALKLTQLTMAELRRNGAWAYLNRIHNEKMNAQLLARTGDGVTFHLYLNRKLDHPDLHGLKLRVTPTYAAFFTALGATPLRTPPGEVYTAMERGVVDGYGFSIQGLFDLGLQEVTKYRVEPGFYSVDVNVLVNLDKYKALRPDQRAFLDQAALWLEGLDQENAGINRRFHRTRPRVTCAPRWMRVGRR
jgi:TRAP-type C4-dicarboxylate transport system substrate-binding protein